MSVTFHDQFCGAGGSTLGAVQAGAVPVVGMNHWDVACATYGANHGQARIDCADVVSVDPRRYPRADMLLTSPECTHHSYARGRVKDDPNLFDPEGDKAAERSRATMWDVPRFAEFHDYRAIIVENVEAAVKWGQPKGRKLAHGSYGPLFAAWLNAMRALDYEHQLVHLNSMVCGVPQSRDRLYVVFWKKGQRKPDLDIPALAWCHGCERMVEARQSWKRAGATTGTYGASYYYACPECRGQCSLAVRPAAAAIDWTLPGQRIGDRATPLKPATMERIRRGLEKLRHRPVVMPLENGLVVQVGGNLFEREGYARAWPTSEPMPTVTGTLDRALVMPVTHKDASQRARRPGEEVFPAITAQQEQALIVANRENAVPRSAAKPMQTIVTQGGMYLVEMRGNPDRPGGGNVGCHPEAEPMGTVTASGNHHGLVIANYGSKDGPKSKQGWARHADDEPLGTVTATDSQALLGYRDNSTIPVEDCSFRMLQPYELKIASAFTPEYVLTGNKREQVCQVGNAVTAPAERELVSRVIAAIA